MLRYHNITKNDMLNGSGLRVVLWTAGCDHHCPGCQNPITWSGSGGIPFDEMAKKEIWDQLKEDHISGITLSGGDPLFPKSRKSVTELCKEIKAVFPDKTIWVYTGYDVSDVAQMEIAEYIDVLVDGPFVQEMLDTSLEWRGSANQAVIPMQKYLHADLDHLILSCRWEPKKGSLNDYVTDLFVSKKEYEEYLDTLPDLMPADDFESLYNQEQINQGKLYETAKKEGWLIYERVRRIARDVSD